MFSLLFLLLGRSSPNSLRSSSMTTCSRISLPPQVCRLRSSSTCIVCPFVYSAQQGRAPKNVTASRPMKNQRQYIDVYYMCASPTVSSIIQKFTYFTTTEIDALSKQETTPANQRRLFPPPSFFMLNHSPTRPTVQSFFPVLFLFILKTKNEN